MSRLLASLVVVTVLFSSVVVATEGHARGGGGQGFAPGYTSPGSGPQIRKKWSVRRRPQRICVFSWERL
jgi:hypothetical protein